MRNPESVGGADKRERPERDHYSNKGSHKERSIANDKRRSGGHKNHWKKEEKRNL